MTTSTKLDCSNRFLLNWFFSSEPNAIPEYVMIDTYDFFRGFDETAFENME